MEAMAESRAPVKQRKSHQSAVPALNLVPARHRLNHMPYLLQRRRFPFPLGRGNRVSFSDKLK